MSDPHKHKSKQPMTRTPPLPPGLTVDTVPSTTKGAIARNNACTAMAMKSEDSVNAGSGGSALDDPGTAADTSQLPLARRLEIAAAHVDVQAALVGLLGWSRLYVNSDKILVFFQSNALQILLGSVLRARLRVDGVYDNLSLLLANCLSCERNGKTSSAHREVASAVVGCVRALIEDIEDKLDDAVSVDKVAKYLSLLVTNYRLALSGIGVDSAISQEILSIEAQLANAASRDGAIKGTTIRESFQRRDIRSDALTLYESRLQKVSILVEKNTPHSTINADPRGLELVSVFLRGSADHDVCVDQVSAVKTELSKLEEAKAGKLKAFEAQRSDHIVKLRSLHQQREALEAQLQRVNAQINEICNEQQDVDASIEAIEAQYRSILADFNHKHEHILQKWRRSEQVDLIKAKLLSLETAISNVTQDDAQSLKDKQVACIRQELEGALRYFGSQLPCLKFMMSRAAESTSALKKIAEESSGYEVLGVHSVVEELATKAESIRRHLAEDQQCIAALRKRDFEVLDMLERLLGDPVWTESLSHVDDALKKEVSRHIEYVRMVYDPMVDQGSGCTATSHNRAGAIGSQKKKVY